MFFVKRITKYRSPGGGPAPLLTNPEPKTLTTASVMHLVLFFVSLSAISFPSFLDLQSSCSGGSSPGTGFLLLLLFLSILVSMYYFFMSKKKLGTEVEWSRVLFLSSLLVSMLFDLHFITNLQVVSEAGATLWGGFILYQKIHSVVHEEGCRWSDVTMWFIILAGFGTCLCMIATVYLFLRMASLILDQLSSLSNFI